MNIMNAYRKNQNLLVAFILIYLVLHLVGCSAPYTNVPITPTSTAEAREVVLTFDGVTCHYQGPKVLSEGELSVSLVNQTDYRVDWWVLRLDEGKTWKDMLDHVGPPGSYVHPPEWSTGSILTAQSVENPDALVYTLTEGLYTIMCCTCFEPVGPRGVWPGSALEVITD